MKVSIALCTYNGETYLQQQLESISAQTRLPDEIIVCDDCSNDTTREILTAFAKKAVIPIELHFNKQNTGFIKNFENSIKLCEGDIIFLSDQDDVWHTEKLEKFISVFEADERVGLVFCDGELVDENLISLNIGAWEARRFDEKKQNSFKNGSGLAMVLNDNVISGCMMAFRASYKDLLLPIPNDIPDVVHDYWIGLLLLTVAKVSFIPEKLVKYRQHNRQQIGMSDAGHGSGNLSDKITKRYNFQAQKLKFEGLKKHLVSRIEAQAGKYRGDEQHLLNELNEQIRHAKARSEIAEDVKLRVPLIAKELFSLRYRRYSNGWRSAVKDLLLYLK